MNSLHITCVTLLLAALVLTACGSSTDGSPNSDKGPENSSKTGSSESEPPEPVPSGTLATEPVPCTKFSAPAGFRDSGAMPPVMCAFESSDARVTVAVGPGPRSFEQLQQVEENAARSKGVAPPALEQVAVDGWTVAAIWPDLGGFGRMDRYLADSAGNVLTCKVGVQGGKVDPTTHAGICDRARTLLYTP